MGFNSGFKGLNTSLKDVRAAVYCAYLLSHEPVAMPAGAVYSAHMCVCVTQSCGVAVWHVWILN